MGTGRSDDPFFDHFDDLFYDLVPNKFLACGSRPVQKRDTCPLDTCTLKRRTHTHTTTPGGLEVPEQVPPRSRAGHVQVRG